MNCSFKHIILFQWRFAAWGKVAANSVAGRMTNDSQKGTIAYNHLGLTKNVTKGTDVLKYTYDATGRRVKRQFKTETARHYIDGVEYEGSVLKFVATPYGRIRKDASGGWTYDYFLKDHLGNVRVVLEAGNSSASNSVTYMATMEEGRAGEEEQYFAGLAATRADRPYNYPDKNPTNAKLAKVPGKSRGPSTMLKVMAGDTIEISAKAFYNMDKTLPGKGVDIAPVVGNAIVAMTSPTGTVLGETARLAVDLGAEASQSVALVNVPQIVDKNGEVKPQSGISFILYNSRMEVVEENTGVLLVEDRINEIQTLASDHLIMQEAGFLEVYINNEAQTPVYYDNFTVAATTSNVVEINAYYPYGMLIPALSIMATPDKWNGYKYSAKELETALNLGWYNFPARPYDPTIGRWISTDPLAEKYYNISPYAYTLNNPILYIDPNGEDVFMYFYVANGEDDDDEDARMFWASALTRANDLLRNGQIKDGDAYTFRAISDLGKLGGAVDQVVREMSPNFGQTAEFGLWSHGALDGPIGNAPTSGEYALGNQMIPEGWGNIDFNFKTDGSARAMFFGCRTASSEGGTVTPWTQTISGNPNMQNVEVWGQTMRSWPSIYPDWGQSTANMRKGIHGGPTYMIGSDKGKFTQFDRVTGKPYQAYPMGIYQNGKFLRNQYQRYR